MKTECSTSFRVPACIRYEMGVWQKLPKECADAQYEMGQGGLRIPSHVL